MTKMEDGLVTWRVSKIRKTYVQSSIGAGSTSNQEQHTGSNTKKVFRKPSTILCKESNERCCTKTSDHDVGLITHKHICEYCLFSVNKQYNHEESNHVSQVEYSKYCKNDMILNYISPSKVSTLDLPHYLLCNLVTLGAAAGIS